MKHRVRKLLNLLKRSKYPIVVADADGIHEVETHAAVDDRFPKISGLVRAVYAGALPIYPSFDVCKEAATRRS